MRASLIAALREYKPDADDAVNEPLWLGPDDGPRVLNRDRFERLMLRALREHEQEIRDLRQRVAALEAAP